MPSESDSSIVATQKGVLQAWPCIPPIAQSLTSRRHMRICTYTSAYNNTHALAHTWTCKCIYTVYINKYKCTQSGKRILCPESARDTWRNVKLTICICILMRSTWRSSTFCWIICLCSTSARDILLHCFWVSQSVNLKSLGCVGGKSQSRQQRIQKNPRLRRVLV